MFDVVHFDLLCMSTVCTGLSQGTDCRDFSVFFLLKGLLRLRFRKISWVRGREREVQSQALLSSRLFVVFSGLHYFRSTVGILFCSDFFCLL
jgi:hypothetical protein